MQKVNVRYIVDNVDSAITFYTTHLDFEVDMHPAPGFAAISRGNLQLYLNQPGAGGAGKTTDDGQNPESGGWNRIQLVVEDIESTVNQMKQAGVQFRNDIVTGQGGKQVLLEDPSGNPVELFEPNP